MGRTSRKILNISVGVALFLGVILFIAAQAELAGKVVAEPSLDEVLDIPSSIAPEPEPSTQLIRGVIQDDIPSALLDVQNNFGKGRIGAFTFNAPREGNFRIEEMNFAIEGARAGDVEKVWLRFNGNGVFTEADFEEENGKVIFRQFPPITKPNTPTPKLIPDVKSEIFSNDILTQLLLRPDIDMPQVMPSGSDVRVTLYALWGESATSRTVKDGLRLCLLSLEGSLIKLTDAELPEEELAETKFAAPLCWNYFGIE